MTQHEIVEHLRTNFPAEVGEWIEMSGGTAYQQRMGSYLRILNASRISDICFYLRDTTGLQFNSLILLSSVDNADGTLSVVYLLESTHLGHQIVLRVTVPSIDPIVPSVTDVWSHANWEEREAWDMMGIRFTGHPDLRRILLEEDFPGHPLRKDFQEPEFYHGMLVPYYVDDRSEEAA